MRQRLFFAVAGAIAIAVTGCASEEETTAVAPSPSPASPTPAASPGGTAFAKPLVAQKPASPSAVPGLIQPTNADERAKQVQAKINAQNVKKDPFSSLPPILQAPTTPTVSALPQGTQSQSVPSLPNAPRPAIPPRVAGSPPNPSSPFPPSKSGPSSTTPAAKPVPPPPSTDLANAVEVSGIVYVDGTARAIVKAPNEATSRYVRVGQRLSDGQVLVKRIELRRGAEPVLVLEENGVEVTRAVGDKGAAGTTA